MERVTFEVEGSKIHCEGCEQRIGSALRQLPGVMNVQASATTQRVDIQLDPARTSPDAVASKLAAIGFPAHRA